MNVAITTNGERIYATDIDVKMLKRYSTLNQLMCPDCKKIVKYSLGGQKSPYFFHLRNSNCRNKDYSFAYNNKANKVSHKKRPLNTNICDKCKSEYSIEYIKGKGYFKNCKCLESIKIHQPKCPACGNKMFLRRNSKNITNFWGCAKYPECKSTLQFNE